LPSYRGDDDAEAALEVTGGSVIFLSDITPEEFSGRYSEADFDSFRVRGPRARGDAVRMPSARKRLELIAELLHDPCPFDISAARRSGNQECPMVCICWDAWGCQQSSAGGSRCMPTCSYERHTSGSLAAIVPEEDFIAATFSLFYGASWRPRSADRISFGEPGVPCT